MTKNTAITTRTARPTDLSRDIQVALHVRILKNAAAIAGGQAYPGRDSAAAFELAAYARAKVNILMWRFRQYNFGEHQLEEMVEEGLLGAHTAAIHFNPAAGSSFIAYAEKYILAALVAYTAENAYAVAVEVGAFKGREGKAHLHELGLGWADTPSFQDPIGSGADAGELGDFEVDWRNDDMRFDESDELRSVVRGLTQPQQQLVHLMFTEDLTNGQVAEHMGITPAGVSKLKARTFAAIKAAFAQLQE
ncbi:sigma-70 family RNA polymerase sigma factor [Cryobacterium sp. CG_9.6]|uniref:sigma-70 family RNA polymerase sigma factor n=1 Tax=Cryobacterium sp. CG_9.6 TaxID=2760710 RepID=UPI0024744A2E|nr:sigma-70 family RNA polymerase sigma factor [Cryobacterium sp. CG_9.6]MDH6236288.1 RNA polymerase sigma factor (sigma-70 family) [Cryobacterium sp. CG_9.6]